MADDADAVISIGADAGPLDKAFAALSANIGTHMGRLTGVVREGFGKITEAGEGLHHTFERITGTLAAVTAVVAGGAAFKTALTDSANWATEAKKLSTQLGISTERASALMVATHKLGIDNDVVTNAAAKMSRQIFINAGAFEKLGVEVKDSSGAYRPVTEVMGEVNEKLAGIKNPIEQNIAGMQVYGRSWQEMRPLLKLTSEQMNEAAVTATRLGLVVGPEQAAQARQYKESIREMGLVTESLEIQLGNVLMPAFVKLGAWMSEEAPAVGDVTGAVFEAVGSVLEALGGIVVSVGHVIADVFTPIGELIASIFGGESLSAMELFVNALKVIEIAFVAVSGIVQLALTVIGTGLAAMVERFVRFAEAGNRALHFDFTGAAAAWQAGTQRLSAIKETGDQRLIDITKKTATELDAIAMRTSKGPRQIVDSKPVGGPQYDFGKEPKERKSRDPRLEDTSKAEYQVAKAQFEADLAQQSEYLKEASAAYDDAYRNNLIDIKGYYAARAAIQTAGIDQEIQAKQREVEANRDAQMSATTERERLGLQAQEIKLTSDLTVLELKRAEAVRANSREMTQAERQRYEALQNIRLQSQQQSANSELAMERIRLDAAKSMHQVSDAQALEAERAFEDRSTEIARQGILARLQMEQNGARDPVKIAELNAQIEALDMQHQQRLLQIDAQAAVERNKYATEATKAFQDGFGTMLSDIMNHTKSLGDVFKSFFANLATQLNNIASKKIAESLFGGGSSGGDWVGSIMGMIFGRASGGAVSPYGAYFVNENNREGFIPNTGGTIVPLSRGGGGNVTINVSVPAGTDRKSALQQAHLIGLATQNALSKNS